VAASSTSCKLTVADRIIGGLGLDGWWPEVFGVWASCADAKVNLLGLPYEFFSGALFVGVAVAAAFMLLRAQRSGR
jgi:protein dithiol:quinone oxidoreductase